MREDFLHYYARSYFKTNGWTLLAGEYPIGSDDELYPLFIKDSTKPLSNNTDHRKHSDNKIVPDLVVCKGNTVLVIEIKPKFNKGDESKLCDLFALRYDELINAIAAHIDRYFKDLKINLLDAKILPCLGFVEASFKKKEAFAYILFTGDKGTLILP